MGEITGREIYGKEVIIIPISFVIIPVQASVFIPEAAMNLHMFSMYQQQEADVIGQCLHTIP